MNQFVTISHIAELLDCSVKTVRRKVDKGIIPAIQPDDPGTLLRFEPEEVLRAVKLTHSTSQTADRKPKVGSHKKQESAGAGSLLKEKRLSGPIPRWKQKLDTSHKES